MSPDYEEYESSITLPGMMILGMIALQVFLLINILSLLYIWIWLFIAELVWIITFIIMTRNIMNKIKENAMRTGVKAVLSKMTGSIHDSDEWYMVNKCEECGSTLETKRHETVRTGDVWEFKWCPTCDKITEKRMVVRAHYQEELDDEDLSFE